MVVGFDAFDFKADFETDERGMLAWFLNAQRTILLGKTSGLSDEQLQQPHPPSSLTLIGLVKHLTRVERYWLQQDLLGSDVISYPDPADPWHLEPGERCADIIEAYKDACRTSDRIVAGVSLDTRLAEYAPQDEGVTLRWALFHMIEETARHCGHADLLRESIDGVTGERPIG